MLKSVIVRKDRNRLPHSYMDINSRMNSSFKFTTLNELRNTSKFIQQSRNQNIVTVKRAQTKFGIRIHKQNMFNRGTIFKRKSSAYTYKNSNDNIYSQTCTSFKGVIAQENKLLGMSRKSRSSMQVYTSNNYRRLG